MSHLPHLLDWRPSWGEARGRNANLTSGTPTTFGMNWNHCENGTANPVASAGATTWMGPPATERAGMGAGWPGASAPVHVFVAERLRGAGLSVNTLPDDWEGEEDDDENEDDDEGDDANNEGSRKRQKKEQKPLRERELAYIRSGRWDFEDFKVYSEEKEEPVAYFTTMSTDNLWLCVSCLNEDISQRVHGILKDDYDLAEFPHIREELPVPRESIGTPGIYRLEAVTGSSSTNPSKSSVNTKFSLYFKDEPAGGDASDETEEKVVAKALCSYQNGEMNSVGPTLELIETAKEWQQHGLGGALMRTIHSFYRDKFGEFEGSVLFSVCYVTNFYAGKWFMRRHHFQDLDGMGEELGKYL